MQKVSKMQQLEKMAGLTKRALSEDFINRAIAARQNVYNTLIGEERGNWLFEGGVSPSYKRAIVSMKTPHIEAAERMHAAKRWAKELFKDPKVTPKNFAAAVERGIIPDIGGESISIPNMIADKVTGNVRWDGVKPVDIVGNSSLGQYRDKAQASIEKLVPLKEALHRKQQLAALQKTLKGNTVGGLLGGGIGAAANDGNRAAGSLGGALGGVAGAAGMRALAGKIGMKGVGSTLANLAAAGAGGYGGGKLGAKLDQHLGNPVTTGVNSAIDWAGDKGNQAISWLKDKLGLGGE